MWDLWANGDVQSMEQEDLRRDKGRITILYTVWCGLCDEFMTVETAWSKISAGNQAREKGWRLTKADGWICPKHKA